MRLQLMGLCSMLRLILSREEGQDLVEYALIVALIALGATVGVGNLANAISGAFSSLGASVTANT